MTWHVARGAWLRKLELNFCVRVGYEATAFGCWSVRVMQSTAFRIQVAELNDFRGHDFWLGHVCFGGADASDMGRPPLFRARSARKNFWLYFAFLPIFRVFLKMCVTLSACLSVCLSVSLSAYLPVRASVRLRCPHLSVHPIPAHTVAHAQSRTLLSPREGPCTLV